MVATSEPTRTRQNNSEVPARLETSYFQAIQEPATLGLAEITGDSQQHLSRAILCVVVIAKEAHTHARFLLEYSEDELLALEGDSIDH
jgi:hypothetical protein